MATRISHGREVGMGIALLLEAYRISDESMTQLRTRLLQRTYSRMPPALVEAAVLRTIDTRPSKGKDYLPSTSELLADAEAVRRALLAKHPYTGCVDCETSPGWRALKDRPRDVERCPCHGRHLAKLAGMGVTHEPIALPPAREMTPVGERV